MIYTKDDNIGLYKVTFPHKQGRYAETYRVKDAGGKTRFLKLINHSSLNHHQTDDDGQLVEVEISKLLNHQNLCSFIDTGSIMVNGAQHTYIVTEFVGSVK